MTRARLGALVLPPLLASTGWITGAAQAEEAPGDHPGVLVASVLPLEWRDGKNPLSSLPGAAAVIVQDPAEPVRVPTEALAELYGLTPAEGRVIEHIAHGQAPQQIADELGVTLTTVKTHLQKIFAKTNTARQADLVQLITRATPPVRDR